MQRNLIINIFAVGLFLKYLAWTRVLHARRRTYMLKRSVFGRITIFQFYLSHKHVHSIYVAPLNEHGFVNHYFRFCHFCVILIHNIKKIL